MSKIDHTQRINDQLAEQITQLIEGVNSKDFTLPFASLAVRPHNVATGHRATGANALIAMLKGSAFYSTFKGWQKLGYQVKSKADFYIARPRRVKTGEKVNESTGDTESQYGVFGFTTDAVWDFSSVRNNVIEGFENPWTPPVIDQVDETERNDRADRYFANIGADVRYTGEGKALYNFKDDYILMPERSLFKATKTSTATECFYSTFAHEHIHRTGHSSRLNRLDSKNKRGYAFEELIAEIGAAMLCIDLGVSSEIRADHLQNLKGWLKALDDDKAFIKDAAIQAQKAVDYLDSLQSKTQQAAA